jgi:4-hydroxy-3-polyprenylbenzoate decarboxylase
MKLLVAITGASGLPLAIRFLEILGKYNIERHIIISEHAKEVQKYEQQIEIDWQQLYEKQYKENEIWSSVCSGTYPIDGMVVIPCSMNTLAAIAHGLENNAITRAVSVNLKQQRRVILVPRETPLSLTHIENLRLAKLAGCSIVLPTIAFYFQPKTIDDLLNHIAGKILELFNISHDLYPSWQS